MKYTKNDNYFDVIDTEHKAYILGFLFADGYNNTKQHQIRITLANSDIGILEAIKSEIFSNDLYKVKTRTSRIRNGYICKPAIDITICSKHISDVLETYGMVAKKSRNLEIPSVDVLLTRHFIRGYFDGDGCIKKSKGTGSAYRYYICICTASLVAANQLQHIIELHTNVHVKIYQVNEHLWSVEIGGNIQCLTFLHWLYDSSSIRLDRKYQRYKELETQTHMLSEQKTSKLKWVSWNGRVNKWIAQRQFNGKKYHIGCFDSEAVAHDAAKTFNPITQ